MQKKKQKTQKKKKKKQKKQKKKKRRKRRRRNDHSARQYNLTVPASHTTVVTVVIPVNSGS
jgi:hypothetical protein